MELWASFHCGSTGRIAESHTYEVGETHISAPPICGPLFFLSNPSHYNKVRIQSHRSSHAHLTHHSTILQYVLMSQPALCSLPHQSDLNSSPIITIDLRPIASNMTSSLSVSLAERKELLWDRSMADSEMKNCKRSLASTDIGVS